MELSRDPYLTCPEPSTQGLTPPSSSGTRVDSERDTTMRGYTLSREGKPGGSATKPPGTPTREEEPQQDDYTLGRTFPLSHVQVRCPELVLFTSGLVTCHIKEFCRRICNERSLG